MKNKFELVKVEYADLTLAELRKEFESNQHYCMSRGGCIRITNLIWFAHLVMENEDIRKSVKVDATLEDELSKIPFGEVKATCFNGLIALCDQDFEMHVSEDFILRIAEAIKRHRK